MRAQLWLSLFLVACSSLLPTLVAGLWTDPCQYHPNTMQNLRLRFESIVGQPYATQAVYAHIQRHIEQHEAVRLQQSEELNEPQTHKPLVLSFHGPTGTGKSLTANSIASALFVNSRSSHIHTYHGDDFSGTSPEAVANNIAYLKNEFATHVRRCSLALFIIEEIHMMAPGVLDGLRHLMDAQAPNSRFKVPAAASTQKRAPGAPSPSATAPNTATIGDVEVPAKRWRASSSGSASQSVAINFSHVIWLFTTNIGSQQVQKAAYDAAKEGQSREAISPTQLHDMLMASLAHSAQLQLLRDSSVLSALVPFFPLFKAHVKECAAVHLRLRKKHWLMNGQLAAFEWDPSVAAYAAGQLKYSGPISIYGCKNVHELLTSVLLAPLTRTFRREQEERDHALSEEMRDSRVSRGAKLWAWGWNTVARAHQLFTGPVWNLGRTNVTAAVQTDAQGKEEIVFVLERQVPVPRVAGAPRGAPTTAVERTEIRQALHASSAQFHTVPETHVPTKHDHLRDDTETPEAATQKDEL